MSGGKVPSSLRGYIQVRMPATHNAHVTASLEPQSYLFSCTSMPFIAISDPIERRIVTCHRTRLHFANQTSHRPPLDRGTTSEAQACRKGGIAATPLSTHFHSGPETGVFGPAMPRGCLEFHQLVCWREATSPKQQRNQPNSELGATQTPAFADMPETTQKYQSTHSKVPS